MKWVRNQKASSRIAGWAKGLLLCLLLPWLDVYAEPYSGTVHWEYSEPWKWTESNLKTVQTATGYKHNKAITAVRQGLSSAAETAKLGRKANEA